MKSGLLQLAIVLALCACISAWYVQTITRKPTTRYTPKPPPRYRPIYTPKPPPKYRPRYPTPPSTGFATSTTDYSTTETTTETTTPTTSEPTYPPGPSSTTCQIVRGHRMFANSGKQVKLDFPCKFNFIRQRCGDWDVRITPGNEYVVPHYIVNTIYIGLKRGYDNWEGRTTNKIAIKYLRGDNSKPVNKIGGSLSTADVFEFHGFTNGVNTGYFTADSKDGAFTILFAPFIKGAVSNQKVLLSFSCNVHNVPPPYPQQLCGGTDRQEVKDRAIELGFDDGGKVDSEARDKTVYYDVFTDTSTNQSPEPVCGQVVDHMVNVCPSDEKRVKAINLCYRILYSRPHRQCVTKYSCKLIDAFYACVRFVCSDFSDQDACQELGDYIDMCRNFPGLTEEVSNCYNGLFISLDDKK